jgi:hypothetical protein
LTPAIRGGFANFNAKRQVLSDRERGCATRFPGHGAKTRQSAPVNGRFELAIKFSRRFSGLSLHRNR